MRIMQDWLTDEGDFPFGIQEDLADHWVTSSGIISRPTCKPLFCEP